MLGRGPAPSPVTTATGGGGAANGRGPRRARARQRQPMGAAPGGQPAVSGATAPPPLSHWCRPAEGAGPDREGRGPTPGTGEPRVCLVGCAFPARRSRPRRGPTHGETPLEGVAGTCSRRRRCCHNAWRRAVPALVSGPGTVPGRGSARMTGSSGCPGSPVGEQGRVQAQHSGVILVVPAGHTRAQAPGEPRGVWVLPRVWMSGSPGTSGCLNRGSSGLLPGAGAQRATGVPGCLSEGTGCHRGFFAARVGILGAAGLPWGRYRGSVCPVTRG